MSLLAVAEIVRAAHTRRSSLLAALLIAAAVTAGLLSMHVLNTHGTISGHHGTVAVAADHGVSAHSTAPVDAGPGIGSVDVTADPGCAGCPTDHSAVWMACVLGLLVAVVLIAAIGARSLRRSRLAGARAVLAPTHHLLRSLPPPSLTALCISRT